jgi:hypothetical protein
MSEEIEDFASMFQGPPGEAQRSARMQRAQKERRTQMTDRQRKRGAERTTQINFRCSPAFLADAKAAAESMTKSSKQKVSVADVMEEALAMFMKAHNIEVTNG